MKWTSCNERQAMNMNGFLYKVADLFNLVIVNESISFKHTLVSVYSIIINLPAV